MQWQLLAPVSFSARLYEQRSCQRCRVIPGAEVIAVRMTESYNIRAALYRLTKCGNVWMQITWKDDLQYLTMAFHILLLRFTFQSVIGIQALHSPSPSASQPTCWPHKTRGRHWVHRPVLLASSADLAHKIFQSFLGTGQRNRQTTRTEQQTTKHPCMTSFGRGLLVMTGKALLPSERCLVILVMLQLILGAPSPRLHCAAVLPCFGAMICPNKNWL